MRERDVREMNYEDDISIDESALDIEWLRQPELTMKYGLEAAQKRKDMDLAKERLDFIRSKLDKEIRENPESRGLVKVTEAAIQNAILLQPEYQSASSDYISAKYEYEIVMVAVKALEAKKAALENLVRLHGQLYFAGPKVPRDLEQEWKKRKDKEISFRISQKLKRTKNHD
jgi:hypothetical protein